MANTNTYKGDTPFNMFPHFDQLYHGSVNGKQYCLGTNVGKEYMCPTVINGHIDELPLHPCFSKQSNQPVRETKQHGGYVWTVNADGLSSINAESNDSYQRSSAQDGYYIKRCVGDRNLHPSRQLGLNEPISTVPSKPPVPPLAGGHPHIKGETPFKPHMIKGGYGGVPFGLPMNYQEVATPEETSNRYIMNYNITPGYYPDMVYDAIGKRPVYTARNIENDIPEIITKNKYNLIGRDAGCNQPMWSPRCI